MKLTLGTTATDKLLSVKDATRKPMAELLIEAMELLYQKYQPEVLDDRPVQKPKGT